MSNPTASDRRNRSRCLNPRGQTSTSTPRPRSCTMHENQRLGLAVRMGSSPGVQFLPRQQATCERRTPQGRWQDITTRQTSQCTIRAVPVPALQQTAMFHSRAAPRRTPLPFPALCAARWPQISFWIANRRFFSPFSKFSSVKRSGHGARKYLAKNIWFNFNF